MNHGLMGAGNVMSIKLFSDLIKAYEICPWLASLDHLTQSNENQFSNEIQSYVDPLQIAQLQS